MASGTTTAIIDTADTIDKIDGKCLVSTITIDKEYTGPTHVIHAPQKRTHSMVTFPSVSGIINESSTHTGIYIKENRRKWVDINWEKKLLKGFKNIHATGELEAYLTSGISNGHPLQLQILAFPANYNFRMHKHPNIEFAYIIGGSLLEEAYHKNNKTTGPLRTISCGHYLSKQTNSTHRSYAGPTGVVILVLWSGKHYNV